MVAKVKAHNLEAVGSLKLSYTPSEPDHAVRLQDLQSVSGNVAFPIFITNVEPVGTGNVGDKLYANTIPSNQVLLSCVSDTQNVRVHFLAESGVSFYNPTITIEGEAVSHIEEYPGDKRLFRGYRDITLTESATISASSSTGATTTVEIVYAGEGPSVQTVEIDSIPAGQTAVKSGDIIQISGTVANQATSATVQNFEAASSGSVTLGPIDSAGPGLRTFSGTAVASSRTGTLRIKVIAANSLGTNGAEAISSDTVLMDQVIPSIGNATVSYPAGQTALADGQSATVSSTVTGATSVSYSYARGSVTSPSLYAASKTVTCSQAVYDTGNNYTITAQRSSNGASAARSFSVAAAGVPATASISIVGAVNIQVVTNSQVSDYPHFGASATAVNSEATVESLSGKSNTTANHQFTVSPTSGEYAWFAYPKALGLATFVDTSNGFSGGWDGATWPIDGTIEATTGPITVTKDGVEWYVYRTDFQGAGGTFSVTFANPGLAVGSGGSTVTVPGLKTSPAGTDYSVRITANQTINVAPSLVASHGAWQGSWAKLSATVWERKLRVTDATQRGAASFSGLVLTNTALLETNAIASGAQYGIAGFVSRVITFAAFSRIAAIGSSVHNIAKVVAKYAGTSGTLALRSDTGDAQNSFTIVNSSGQYDPKGDHLWLSDANFAASNTSGTLQVEIEETL